MSAITSTRNEEMMPPTFFDGIKLVKNFFTKAWRERGLIIALWLTYRLILDFLGLGYKYENALQLTFLPMFLDLRTIVIATKHVKDDETMNFALFFERLEGSITRQLRSPEDKRDCYKDLEKLLRHAKLHHEEMQQIAATRSTLVNFFASEMGRDIAEITHRIQLFSEQMEIVKACEIERLTIDLLESAGDCILTHRDGGPIAYDVKCVNEFVLYERCFYEEESENWSYEPLFSLRQSESLNDGRYGVSAPIYSGMRPDLASTMLEIVYENGKKEVIPLP